MTRTESALKSSMESIRAAEKMVQDAFIAEVSPAIAAAGGRIRLVVSVPTRTPFSITSYRRTELTQI